jgi:uncharacterized protein (DUF2062 family)
MYEWLVVDWGVVPAAIAFAFNVAGIIVAVVLIARSRRRKRKAQRDLLES